MSIWRKLNDTLLEMSNVRGKYVKTDDINFSFYFSDRTKCNHGIRVKVQWTLEKVSGSPDGYFELHGDYKYRQSKDSDKHPSSKDISDARDFFKKYIVLFQAVWNMKLEEDDLVDYFRGFISLKDLIDKFENISNYDKEKIREAETILELEEIISKNNIFQKKLTF